MSKSSVAELLEVVAKLRDPVEGCPWDRAQSYRSIVPHTIEEAYEVAEVIESGTLDDLPDELGDLLFQVVFYAQLGREEQRFDFDHVVDAIVTKMIRRHPHVFSDVEYDDLDAQTAAWERIKAGERADGCSPPASALDGVALSLPALSRAAKLQRKASRVGFDWDRLAPVLDKVAEELRELREALNADSPSDTLRHELGDLLFACVNVARHLDLDPEHTLRAANRRFERRFGRMESLLSERGSSVSEVRLADLDGLWEQAKRELSEE